MEMSQKIHFWYQITLKMMIFWENDKKSPFFGKKDSWKANRKQFWVENAEIAWKSYKDRSLGGVFLYFFLFFFFFFFFFFSFFFSLKPYLWKCWPNSAKKSIFAPFLPQNYFFGIFWSEFSKIRSYSKKWDPC